MPFRLTRFVKLIHKKSIFLSAFFLLPSVIVFSKITFAAYYLPLSEFGRLSLYLGISSALVYIFNSGLYEGHLRHFSALQLGGRSRRLSLLQLRAECLSFVGLIIGILLTSAFLFTEITSESAYLMATIFAAHAQSHLNVTTARDRVRNDLLRVAIFHIIRALVPALVFVGLVFFSGADAATAYLCENIALTLILVVYLVIRIRVRCLRNVHQSLGYVKSGIWLCYASSIRQFYFAVERILASLLLSPLAMGEYGRLLLIYQIFIVLGGVISQFLQQRVLIRALSVGVRTTGFLLLKYQGILILVGLVFVLTPFTIFPDYLFNLINVLLGPNVNFWAFSAILLSGLLAGTSLVDSLALGSSRGIKFLKFQAVGGLIWVTGFFVLSNFFDPWTINLQSIGFLGLILFFALGNIRFISIH